MPAIESNNISSSSIFTIFYFDNACFSTHISLELLLLFFSEILSFQMMARSSATREKQSAAVFVEAPAPWIPYVLGASYGARLSTCPERVAE